MVLWLKSVEVGTAGDWMELTYFNHCTLKINDKSVTHHFLISLDFELITSCASVNSLSLSDTLGVERENGGDNQFVFLWKRNNIKPQECKH